MTWLAEHPVAWAAILWAAWVAGALIARAITRARSEKSRK